MYAVSQHHQNQTEECYHREDRLVDEQASCDNERYAPQQEGKWIENLRVSFLVPLEPRKEGPVTCGDFDITFELNLDFGDECRVEHNIVLLEGALLRLDDQALIFVERVLLLREVGLPVLLEG